MSDGSASSRSDAITGKGPTQPELAASPMLAGFTCRHIGRAGTNLDRLVSTSQERAKEGVGTIFWVLSFLSIPYVVRLGKVGEKCIMQGIRK